MCKSANRMNLFLLISPEGDTFIMSDATLLVQGKDLKKLGQHCFLISK